MIRRILPALVGILSMAAFAACAPLHQQNAENAFQQGHLDEAVSEVQAGVNDDPGNLQLKHLAARIYTQRGKKFYDQNEMITAQYDFQRATDLEPTYGPAWDYLGLVAFAEHDWQNAINYGSKAASLSGEPTPAYVSQAEQQLRV